MIPMVFPGHNIRPKDNENFCKSKAEALPEAVPKILKFWTHKTCSSLKGKKKIFCELQGENLTF